jgi:hypothetical protein
VFVVVVETKFGAFSYRRAIQDLMAVRQEGTVEEYTNNFQSIQFQVSMFNDGFDEMFFVSHFVNSLRDDIRDVVQN